MSYSKRVSPSGRTSNRPCPVTIVTRYGRSPVMVADRYPVVELCGNPAKSGTRSIRHGLSLLPDLFAHLNPMTHQRATEIALAKELRGEGLRCGRTKKSIGWCLYLAENSLRNLDALVEAPPVVNCF